MPESSAAPTPEALRRARLLWQQGGSDLNSARVRRKEGAHLESAYLSFQAAINALSAVCYLHGQFRIPNFSPVQLASLCEGFDGQFSALAAPCAELEGVQKHGPFDAATDGQALGTLSKDALQRSLAVQDAVRRYLTANRKRFFTP